MATVILTVIKIHPVVLELPNRIELLFLEYKTNVITIILRKQNKTTNIARPSYMYNDKSKISIKIRAAITSYGKIPANYAIKSYWIISP